MLGIDLALLCGKRQIAHAALVGGDSDFMPAFEAGAQELTSDGHTMYLDAVEAVFGEHVDYAQLIKEYGIDPTPDTRYSPAKVLSAEKRRILGQPDMRSVSTSNIERQNLTLRMSSRRFTRLTNGFSKKLDNMQAAVALHFLHYNFARSHASLKGATPAQAAGVSRYRWSCEEIAGLLDDPQYAEALKVEMRRSVAAS